MLKKHSSILTLIVIVCGGIFYSMYSSNSLFPRKPVRLDSRCYGVDVPRLIKYNQIENFCSCVHVGGHVSKEENYKYCVNLFNSK